MYTYPHEFAFSDLDCLYPIVYKLNFLINLPLDFAVANPELNKEFHWKKWLYYIALYGAK